MSANRTYLLVWLVSALAFSASCSSYKSYGQGATLDDRKVHEKTKYRAVFGLVGSAPVAKVAQRCPDGDALVEKSPAWLNYTIVGLFLYRTTITVYCRDDAYRAARLERRRQNAEKLQAFQEQVDRDSAERNARWNQRTATQAPSNAPPAQGQPREPTPAPQHASPPPSGSGNAPPAPVHVERRRVSNAKATATSAAQCEEFIPATKTKGGDAMSDVTLTRMSREPCKKCVAGGKTFSIYGYKPLRSSCD